MADVHHLGFRVLLITILVLYSVHCQGGGGSSIRQSRFTLQEELPVGTVVGSVRDNTDLTARHTAAELAQMSFVFRGNDASYRYFTISETTGMIRTVRRIDREEVCVPSAPTCSLSLDVTVRPLQFFQIIRVAIDIIDVNDNAPVFPMEQFAVEVKETTSPGALFTIPTAVDADSGLLAVQHYRLVGVVEAFQLVFDAEDPTKDVRLKLLERLDRETTSEYALTVTASDGGVPPRVGSMLIDIVVLDSNDNNPQFDSSSYAAEVSESRPIGTTILRVHASDADEGLNADILYGFAEHTDRASRLQFDIDNKTGDIFLKMALDYERQRTYQLSVVAMDTGPGSLAAFARVSVVVTDENDNMPQVTLNTLTDTGLAQVIENADPGTFVAYVVAKDADSGPSGQTTCAIDSRLFRLELASSRSAEYKLTTTVTFNREERSEYIVRLTCADRGTPSLTATRDIAVSIMDENDNSPIFAKSAYMISFEESNSIGAPVAVINASDADFGQNAELMYSLISVDGTTENSLTVESSTGRLRAGVVFDYEQIREYRYRLTAADNGDISLSATVPIVLKIVDIDDEYPRFQKSAYYFTITENLPIGTMIGVLSATDADVTPAFSKIRYRFSGGNLDFDIDGNNGEVLTIKKKKVPTATLR